MQRRSVVGLPLFVGVLCKGQGTMADTGAGVTDYSVVVVTLIVGATVLVLVYISSLLKSSKEEDDSKSKEISIADILRHRHRLLFKSP